VLSGAQVSIKYSEGMSCQIESNSASQAGGILVNAATLSILFSTTNPNASCTLFNNTATFQGGALLLERPLSVELWSLSISNNSVSDPSGSGGALYASGASATINVFNSNWRGNQAGFGGAIFLSDSKLNTGGTRFEDNMASSDGGALHCTGSLALLTASVTLTASNLSRNIAGNNGGGVVVNNCQLVADNSQFEWNEALHGGAALVQGSSKDFNFTEASFFGNRAEQGRVKNHLGCVRTCVCV
jgi:predicted outer membrane repeat protein